MLESLLHRYFCSAFVVRARSASCSLFRFRTPPPVNPDDPFFEVKCAIDAHDHFVLNLMRCLVIRRAARGILRTLEDTMWEARALLMQAKQLEAHLKEINPFASKFKVLCHDLCDKMPTEDEYAAIAVVGERLVLDALTAYFLKHNVELNTNNTVVDLCMTRMASLVHGLSNWGDEVHKGLDTLPESTRTVLEILAKVAKTADERVREEREREVKRERDEIVQAITRYEEELERDELAQARAGTCCCLLCIKKTC